MSTLKTLCALVVLQEYINILKNWLRTEYVISLIKV